MPSQLIFTRSGEDILYFCVFIAFIHVGKYILIGNNNRWIFALFTLFYTRVILSKSYNYYVLYYKSDIDNIRYRPAWTFEELFKRALPESIEKN